MKTWVIVLCGLVGLIVLLYGCTHELTYETVYPRVVTEIESIGLSDVGEVLVATRKGYLTILVLAAARDYPNGFQRREDLKKKAPLPQWSKMIAGPVPAELWQTYKPVKVIKGGIESTNYLGLHAPQSVDAIVTFENEAYCFGEAFAWLEFRLYSNRPLYRGLRPSSAAQYFWVEIPATLKSHVVPRHTNFMSIGG